MLKVSGCSFFRGLELSDSRKRATTVHISQTLADASTIFTLSSRMYVDVGLGW